MIEQFIELTNQIFWEGYAEQLAKDNPACFQSELNDFLKNYQQAMDDTIFLLVKVKIKTSYKSIHDAIAEVQKRTTFTIGSSKKVKVVEAQLIQLKTKK